MSTAEKIAATERTQQDNYAAKGLEVYWLTLNGLNIRAGIRRGDRSERPLMLMNGVGASLELLEPFIDAMEGTEIIIYDAPGAGKSDAPKTPWRHKTHAKLAAKILDIMGYHKVDVLGLSWGGMLAQQFARQYPERCNKLILCATGPGQLMVPGRMKTLVKMASPRRYVDAGYMNKVAGDLYGGSLRTDKGKLEEHVRKVKPPSTRGYYYQVLSVAGWSSLTWLHKLNQPTLIIHGTDDPIIPAVNARLMAARIPNVDLWLVDCGHLFMITMAEELAPELRAFLEDDN